MLLRLAGLILMAIAAGAVTLLRERAVGNSIEGDPLAYLLALLSFLGGSGGLTLAVLGSHIYDRVEISSRWRRLID